MSVETAIQDGANIFEDAEKMARTIKENMRRFRKTVEEVRNAGHIGGLEAQAIAGEADALATKFEADLYALHSRLTVRAQELGIDLPQPRSGGR